MRTTDEFPLEDHRYFLARLSHLETHHPAALLAYLEAGTLTQHLRQVTARTMLSKADLVVNRNLPMDQADEIVMYQLVADPQERSSLSDPMSRQKLRILLEKFKATLADLPRTYLSENETTE